MHAANFFDFRGVAGDLKLGPLERAVQSCAQNERFLAHMAKQVLNLRPQISLFGRIGTRDHQLDLKADAVGPLVGLGRIYGLEAGLRTTSTIERFEGAARANVLSSDTASVLSEAFRFTFDLRLEAQIKAVRAKQAPTNTIDLDRLSSLDRRHLKESLLAIRDAQNRLERRYQVHALG